jgi:hypothetical protein
MRYADMTWDVGVGVDVVAAPDASQYPTGFLHLSNKLGAVHGV